MDAAFDADQVVVAGVTPKFVCTAASAMLIRDMDRIPNPLPPPYDLTWYFSWATMPDEVRIFATRLGRPNIRVWSVVQSSALPDMATVVPAWCVLVQVFGADDKDEAAMWAAQAAGRPRLSLQQHELAAIRAVKVDAKLITSFLHTPLKKTVEKEDPGLFVEYILPRVK